MNNAVEIKNLTCEYKGRTILENISVSIPGSSITAILGENGAGKSTLFKYLIKEKPCSPGRIFIQNKDITAYTQKALAAKISLLNQRTSCAGDFTVKELVSLGDYVHDTQILKKMNSPQNTVIENAIEELGLSPLKNKKISEISGGEFQRTMIARTLVQNTPVILLDEPVNNLDPRYAIQVMDILKKESSNGKTVLCILHNVEIAKKYADNVILLKNKKVLAQGKTSQALTENNIINLYGVDI